MFQIKDQVYWVGIKDWELRTFHGEEYTTNKGSSYNAYLIKDEKTALVDTVWHPFKKEFIDNLEKGIGLENIDLIVVNHAEPDHSGALADLINHLPNLPIYCTAKGKEIIYEHYHQDWNFQIVKTGDSLNLGKNELVFVEAPMLHWPDTMFTYIQGSNILLSNDAFGQHYATSGFFNDEVDQCELFLEAMKYYANILTPFSLQVKRKIEQLIGLNLAIDIIAPSHGVIWRDNPLQIVEKYQEWARDYQENRVVILYDTMWEGTKKMAEAIAKGLRKEGLPHSLLHTAKNDNTQLMLEVFKAKGVLVGSSTINNGILTSIAAVLEELKGLKFKNKKAAAFGSYGWSGESVKIITNKLEEAKFEVVNQGIKVKYTPTEEELKQCEEFGRDFAKTLK